MISSYAHWIVRHRVLVVVGVLAVVLLAASGGRFLTFKNDYRMFFSADNPQLVAFEHLQATYTKQDNILFVLAPKGGSVFTPEVLSAVEDLTRGAWQIPHARRVDSVTNFQHTAAEGDNLVVGDLVRSAADLNPEAVERIKSIALREPLLVDRLVSPDGSVAGVNVTIQLPGVNEAKEVPEVAAAARDLAARVRTEHPELDVRVTGLVAMNAAFSESSERDMVTLVPIMLLLIVVTMGVLLRAIWGTLAVLLIILLSIAGAIGLAGWLGIAVSPTSAAAPNIILTLAIVYCVHILANFFETLRVGGKDKREAIVETLRVNMQPVFLAALTTAIGFLSMNASDAPPFRDLGNIIAMGTGITFLLAITFLPAFLAILPVQTDQRPSPTTRSVTKVAEFVIRHRTPLFWGMLGLAAVLTAAIPRNELNDQYVKYFDPSIDFRTATDFATDNLTGIYYIDYSLGTGAPGGVNDPEYLAMVEEFANWYRRQPNVLHVNSITDIIKKLNQNMHGNDPAYYRIPDRRELTSQYLLLYEMSLPYGLDLNDRIDVDKSAARLTVTLNSISSQDVLALEERAQAWLADHARPSMRADGASPTIMFAHIGQRNIESMLTGVAVALVLISLILVFALRSIKFGLLSLVPNIIPIAMGFGLWGLVVGQVGLASSVVAAMTLGIVVDDTVHFLSKYLRARREQGLSPEDAVRYAFSRVGTAIWVSSVVLMVGFSVLALSGFEINSAIGLLTVIIVGCALFADVLFLPALLIRIDKKTTKETSFSVTPAQTGAVSSGS